MTRHASATEDMGHASATGAGGHASASGVGGHASASGVGGHASATGWRGHASAAGVGGHASATGAGGHASATGVRGHALAAGDYGHASATGDQAVAFSAQWCAEATGRDGLAIGRTVRISVDAPAAVVLPPLDVNVAPAVITVADGWPTGVWTEFRRSDDGEWWLVADPDILVADDGRGYRLRHADGRYVAGCRNFTATEAVAHWANPNHEAPKSAKILHDAVAAHCGVTS